MPSLAPFLPSFSKPASASPLPGSPPRLIFVASQANTAWPIFQPCCHSSIQRISCPLLSRAYDHSSFVAQGGWGSKMVPAVAWVAASARVRSLAWELPHVWLRTHTHTQNAFICDGVEGSWWVAVFVLSSPPDSTREKTSTQGQELCCLLPLSPPGDLTSTVVATHEEDQRRGGRARVD